MRPRILTVDDSRTVRIIVRNAFKAYDCEVIEAGDGVEGLAKARSKPDLVLLDITMPGMDGVAMLEQMHADPELKDVPVVMLTAEGQKEIAERAIALGSRGYLRKPFGNDVLISHVRTIIPLAAKPAAVPA